MKNKIFKFRFNHSIGALLLAACLMATGVNAAIFILEIKGNHTLPLEITTAISVLFAATLSSVQMFFLIDNTKIKKSLLKGVFMPNENFEATAAKHGLTPERLDKLCAELYGILAAYEPDEVKAVAELIESGTPSRSRGKGAER